MIPGVVVSETGGAQTVIVQAMAGVMDRDKDLVSYIRITWDGKP